MRYKIISALSAILLFSLLISTQVQGASELIIQPSRFELLLFPGRTETQAITIINNGDETIRIGVDVRDWEMDEEGNPLFILPGESFNSCANWLKFNPRVFLLSPGGQQIVRFSITTPSRIHAGEYRCALLFAGEPMESESNLAFANNILVTVYGYNQPISRHGSLDEVNVDYKKETGLNINCKISSSGNAHLRLAGHFKVTDRKNMVKGEGLYLGTVVFPGRFRFFTGNLPIKLPPGEYRVESEFFFVPPLYAVDLLEYKADENSIGFKNITAFTVDAE